MDIVNKKLKPIYNSVQSKHLNDFFKIRTDFIKSRVRLLCSLTILMYFIVMGLWILLEPSKFTPIDISIGILIMLASAIVLGFNTKINTFNGARYNGYFFVIFLLILLLKIGAMYKETPMMSGSVFVFTLYFVAIVIPWDPVDIFFIGSFHGVAYTVSYLVLKDSHNLPAYVTSPKAFVEGSIFLFSAFLLCYIIRKEETKRDIENFNLFRQVSDINIQNKKELRWARTIHKTLIPNSLEADNADIGVTYLPAYYIGGDYAQFSFVEKDKLLFIIMDVTGHGIPAALLVNRVHSEYETLSKEKDVAPGKLLKKLNEFIKNDFGEIDMYLSAFCGIIDFKKNEMKYSSYGHPDQYVYDSKLATVKELKSQTSLLGVPLDDEKEYQESLEIVPGDLVLLFTDGVTETANGEKEEFGPSRVVDFINSNHSREPENINKALIDDLNKFKTGDFNDDVCILTIKVKEKHSFLGVRY